ncbi:DUF2500 domain-containing protein [Paenibacillus curdlanolyticus]|uniref:DUF2500 domain-containing protein n=1 Tax=Paenibacillus curdlanolyticus TaxID=59840 RepID=UPI001F2FFC80|nr:DUF2500 domain-containing protein [Paenibacillus curdlanolyticus]
MNDPSFASMFGEMPVFMQFFFAIVVILIVGGIVSGVTRAVSTGLSNQAAELLTEYCQIVSKRTKVSGGDGDSSASTSYYITFEFANRSRTEFRVTPQDYGLLAEGDFGYLSYKGTRFKGFDRHAQNQYDSN